MASSSDQPSSEGDPKPPTTTPGPRGRSGESETDIHALSSKERGTSEVERVTCAIEKRRSERVVVTHDVQVTLLEDCLSIALEKNYKVKSKITRLDLTEYHTRIRQEYESSSKNSCTSRVLKFFGFPNDTEQLLHVLARAEIAVASQGDNDPNFHYMDFSAYYTKVESRWPWMRKGVGIAAMYVLGFYFFTPIYFCKIAKDPGICPHDDASAGPGLGWMAALYFASETLSTVGYGEVTVNKENPYHVLAGILYMILANMTLIGSFSYALNLGWNPFGPLHERLVKWSLGKASHDEPLHTKLKRVKLLRLMELYGGFIVLNMIGVFANRIFLKLNTEPLKTDWTWLVSIYWAVQSTTTIGYGDLQQPLNQRWFQVFYLVISAYYAGNALAQLAGLREELEQIRREYAWGRREITKNLIDELQPEHHDGKIDQYEFLVASLVQLGKISSEDVVPIMDKFRSLAGESGYIAQEDHPVPEATDKEIQDAIDDVGSIRLRLRRRKSKSKGGGGGATTTSAEDTEGSDII